MIFMHRTECQTLALSTQVNKPLKSRKEKDEAVRGGRALSSTPSSSV